MPNHARNIAARVSVQNNNFRLSLVADYRTIPRKLSKNLQSKKTWELNI